MSSNPVVVSEFFVWRLERQENVVFLSSLRSRRLEVVGERDNGSGRGKHGRGEGAPARKAPENRSLSPRVSPFRAPVFSRAHYFQAPATQATFSNTTWRVVFLRTSPYDLG